MSNIKESVDVDVPVEVAYNQWTQFESFPQFMDGVVAIDQITDTTNRWTVDVGGTTRQFTTEITEQLPDERIAWSTVKGETGHAGAVIKPGAVHIEPDGFIEQAGDKLGFVSRRVKGDRKRFKAFIEDKGRETGAWRGTVRARLT